MVGSSDLEKHDVVITTLQTLNSEWKNYAKALSESDSEAEGAKKKSSTAKVASALFGVKWLRVIVGGWRYPRYWGKTLTQILLLDEAQTIKNRSAQGTKAAIALRAKFRWCLTGTPIQVSLNEPILHVSY